MTLSAFLLNWILLREAGMAVFTSGWRIVTIGIVPMLGMAIGVTAVCGAAYGARDGKKLEAAYLYAVRFGVVLEISAAGAVATMGPTSPCFSPSPPGAPLFTLSSSFSCGGWRSSSPQDPLGC